MCHKCDKVNKKTEEAIEEKLKQKLAENESLAPPTKALEFSRSEKEGETICQETRPCETHHCQVCQSWLSPKEDCDRKIEELEKEVSDLEYAIGNFKLI